MSPRIEDATCRYCGATGRIRVEWRLEAKPLGTYSIAGLQPKAVARSHPYATCGGCGHVSRGQRVEQDQP